MIATPSLYHRYTVYLFLTLKSHHFHFFCHSSLVFFIFFYKLNYKYL